MREEAGLGGLGLHEREAEEDAVADVARPHAGPLLPGHERAVVADAELRLFERQVVQRVDETLVGVKLRQVRHVFRERPHGASGIVERTQVARLEGQADGVDTVAVGVGQSKALPLRSAAQVPRERCRVPKDVEPLEVFLADRVAGRRIVDALLPEGAQHRLHVDAEDDLDAPLLRARGGGIGLGQRRRFPFPKDVHGRQHAAAGRREAQPDVVAGGALVVASVDAKLEVDRGPLALVVRRDAGIGLRHGAKVALHHGGVGDVEAIAFVEHLCTGPRAAGKRPDREEEDGEAEARH